jgi:hypothetical protein
MPKTQPGDELEVDVLIPNMAPIQLLLPVVTGPRLRSTELTGHARPPNDTVSFTSVVQAVEQEHESAKKVTDR